MAGGQWSLLVVTHAAAAVSGCLVMFVRCWRRCDKRHHVEDTEAPDWLCGQSGESD